MVSLWTNDSSALYLLRQVVALVAFASVDDTTVKLLLGDAGTLGEQFAAAIAAIAVHRHTVGLLWVERFAV